MSAKQIVRRGPSDCDPWVDAGADEFIGHVGSVGTRVRAKHETALKHNVVDVDGVVVEVHKNVEQTVAVDFMGKGSIVMMQQTDLEAQSRRRMPIDPDRVPRWKWEQVRSWLWQTGVSFQDDECDFAGGGCAGSESDQLFPENLLCVCAWNIAKALNVMKADYSDRQSTVCMKGRKLAEAAMAILCMDAGLAYWPIEADRGDDPKSLCKQIKELETKKKKMSTHARTNCSERKIFIAGEALHTVGEAGLREYFGSFGKVESIEVMAELGIGNITFHDKTCLEHVLKNGGEPKHHHIEGEWCEAKLYKDKDRRKDTGTQQSSSFRDPDGIIAALNTLRECGNRAVHFVNVSTRSVQKPIKNRERRDVFTAAFDVARKCYKILKDHFHATRPSYVAALVQVEWNLVPLLTSCREFTPLDSRAALCLQAVLKRNVKPIKRFTEDDLMEICDSPEVPGKWEITSLVKVKLVKWGRSIHKWAALWAAEKAAAAAVATTITTCDVAERDDTDLVEQLRRDLAKCQEEDKKRQEEHEKLRNEYEELCATGKTLRAEREEADRKRKKALKKQENLEKDVKDLQRKNKRLDGENAEVVKNAKRRVKNAAHGDKDSLIQEYVRDLESDANQKIDAANQRVVAVKSDANQKIEAANQRVVALLRENEHLKLYLSNWLLVRR